MSEPVLTSAGTQIKGDFKKLVPFVVGDPPHDHFIIHQNELHCIKDTCEGCDLRADCQHTETDLPQDPIPHPRRGIGLELREFLVLRSTTIVEESLSVCGIPYAVEAYDEANHHHFLQPIPEHGLWVGKGQIRYYGTVEELQAEEFGEFFEVVNHYSPVHRPVSLDFSSIEPRVTTLASREPVWLQVFQGEPKAIYREVGFSENPESWPEHVAEFKGHLWCWLNEDPSKWDYDQQCSGCSLATICHTKKEHFRYVSQDFHMVNASALYAGEFDTAQQNDAKRDLKEMRGKSKIVGLALAYGGTAFTVSKATGWLMDYAQNRIDLFFARLNRLQEYMTGSKAAVFLTHTVSSLFGRIRDMRRWTAPPQGTSFEQVRKAKGFAERTSLNGPIQSTAGDILKIAAIRANNWLAEKGLSPFCKMAIPQKLPRIDRAYEDLKITPYISVHDEEGFISHDGVLLTHLPTLYEVMQLGDVLAQFKAGFTLELDVEYDDFRSWTATKAIPTALIYLLQQQVVGSIDKGVDEEESKRTILVIDVAQLADQAGVLQYFQTVAESVASGSYQPSEGEAYPVAVRFPNSSKLAGFCTDIPKGELTMRGIPFSEERLLA